MIVSLPWTGVRGLITVEYQDVEPVIPAAPALQSGSSYLMDAVGSRANAVKGVTNWKVTVTPPNQGAALTREGITADIINDALKSVVLNGNQT